MLTNGDRKPKKKKKWVLKPENSLVWHEQVLAWINKYSGVEKETQGVKEIAVVEDKRQKTM